MTRDGNSLMARLARAMHDRLVVRAYRTALTRSAIGLVRPGASHRRPQRWLFVVGCYNSGTTLLQTLLGAHPQISALKREGVRYVPQLPVPEDYGWTRLWARCEDGMKIDPENSGLAQSVQDTWALLHDPAKPVWLEKSISNLPRMEWLARQFPEARFIGMVRNAYPVAEGIRRRARPRGDARAQYGDTYPIALTAEQWAVAGNRLRELSAKVGHYTELRYEELLADPVAAMQRLFAFAGVRDIPLELKDQVLSIAGQKFPIDRTTSRVVEKLSDEDIETITRIAGPTLEEFGYPLLNVRGNLNR